MTTAVGQDGLREAAAVLQAAGIERPWWTAEQIAAAVLGCEPVAWVVDPPPVPPPAAAEIRRRVARRAAGVPLQHLTGIAGFYGQDVLARPGVFIPRPETERVVEMAARELARLQGLSPGGPRDTMVSRGGPVVFDVGTGSGVVAISLTRTAPVGTMVGFDISRQALGLAQENACRLGVAPRIRWVRADLLTACAAATADLIVANLPYIPSSALAALPREVQWDPPEALDGGPDGLALIQRLLAQATTRLRPRGAVVLEVGDGQAAALRRAAAGAWGTIEVVRDDPGVERVVICRRAVTGHG